MAEHFHGDISELELERESEPESGVRRRNSPGLNERAGECGVAVWNTPAPLSNILMFLTFLYFIISSCLVLMPFPMFTIQDWKELSSILINH